MQVLSDTFRNTEWEVAPPLDAKRNPDFNVRNLFLAVTPCLLLKGRVALWHFSLQPSTDNTLETKLAQAQHRETGFWFRAQSVSSSFRDRAQMQNLRRAIFRVVRPACLYGAPWRQEEQVVSNHSTILFESFVASPGWLCFILEKRRLLIARVFTSRAC